MNKKVRVEIRMLPDEKLKLVALASQAKLSESEVIRTLITSGSVIEKPSNEDGKLAEIEGQLTSIQSAFTSLIEAVASRMESMEAVMVEQLSVLPQLAEHQSQILERLSSPLVQKIDSPPVDDDRPSFESFCMAFPATVNPLNALSDKQRCAKKYQEKFGIWPSEVPRP